MKNAIGWMMALAMTAAGASCADDDSGGKGGGAGTTASGGTAGTAGAGGSGASDGSAAAGGSSGAAGTAGAAGAAGSGGEAGTGASAGTAGADAGPETGVCIGTDAGVSGDSIEIAGTWMDEFATTITIANDAWTSSSSFGTSVYHLTEVDNTGDFAIAQNDCANDFGAGLWSRFDWTYVGGDLYFCQTAFDAASAMEARQTARADASDPATGGCSTFPWSLLISSSGS